MGGRPEGFLSNPVVSLEDKWAGSWLGYSWLLVQLCSLGTEKVGELSAPGLGVGTANGCVVRKWVTWLPGTPGLKGYGEEVLYKWEPTVNLKFLGSEIKWGVGEQVNKAEAVSWVGGAS